jgi:hypothetical protein
MATAKPLSEEPLYRAVERMPRDEGKEVDLTFIPYYAWANRLPGAMEVWIPYSAGGKVAVAKRQAARGTDTDRKP